ncbi:MAG: M23 family metallopeptidase [Micromonosporaceae bacterium]
MTTRALSAFGKAALATCAGLAIAIAMVLVPADRADAALTGGPLFQMPFPCGQTWNGNSSNSSAHQSYEIDFNRTDDVNDPVVAADAGIVRTAAHQGSVNRYGNLIKIEHPGGWFSYYAHLNRMDVSVGASVKQGQQIGIVGNTSAPGNNITPHLHFELRNGPSYPSNIKPAHFDGIRFNYTAGSQDLTSRNCDDPEALCGAGYDVIDLDHLDASGVHHGTVYLTWNGTSNCVVTVKHRNRGATSTVTAYIEPEGSTRVTDTGAYFNYAGPVRKAAPGCVRWGGAIGSVVYNSPLEHCGG